MKKANKILLNIVSVICFIYGALYIFSLVFIPIGIYCFVAGKLFSHKADHLLDNYSIDKKAMKAYTIFTSIFCFPFGLLVIIPYFGLYGNNVKINEFEYTKITEVENPNNVTVEDVHEESKTETKNDTVSVEEHQETEEEKLEKLEKLKNFRDKNIISEEEFEMAKEQMFGKDKK